MPRNASGAYTLPESAFVSGTVIQSAPMNSDLSDIASALTLSLATTGVSTMTGPVKAASGTVTAPSYTFGSATGTGFYLSAANEISWTAAGVLAATFAATGAVTWVGAQTFQSSVTFSGGLSLTSTLSVVTGTEPAVTIRNSDNDASEHELIRYALGSGAGDTASRRIIGSGANDVTQIRDYIASTEILRQTASLVSPKKNISLDAGITVIATAGYCDLTEISAPAAPAANVARAYSKDLAGATILAYQDSAATETILTPPARAYDSYVDNTDITGAGNVIPRDDTIPQNTEGTEILSASITLKKSNSRVRIIVDLCGACSSSQNDDPRCAAIAIFKDSGADAIKASRMGYDGSNISSTTLMGFSACIQWEEAPGAGTFTYSVRVGVETSTDVLRLNGLIGSRLYGGVAAATLTIQEVYV